MPVFLSGVLNKGDIIDSFCSLTGQSFNLHAYRGVRAVLAHAIPNLFRRVGAYNFNIPYIDSLLSCGNEWDVNNMTLNKQSQCELTLYAMICAQIDIQGLHFWRYFWNRKRRIIVRMKIKRERWWVGCAFWYWVNKLFEQKQFDSMRYRIWRYFRDLEDMNLLDDWYVSKARHTSMLVRRSSPSTNPNPSSTSAFFHRPWFQYVDARSISSASAVHFVSSQQLLSSMCISSCESGISLSMLLASDAPFRQTQAAGGWLIVIIGSR